MGGWGNGELWVEGRERAVTGRTCSGDPMDSEVTAVDHTAVHSKLAENVDERSRHASPAPPQASPRDDGRVTERRRGDGSAVHASIRALRRHALVICGWHLSKRGDSPSQGAGHRTSRRGTEGPPTPVCSWNQRPTGVSIRGDSGGERGVGGMSGQRADGILGPLRAPRTWSCWREFREG